MWFKFPQGYEGISVEQQQFVTEYTDKDGLRYFRAPDHFAPKILTLGLGFASMGEMPDGAPEDLAKEDPSRNAALRDMSQEMAGLRVDAQNLRESLVAASSQLRALMAERDSMTKQIVELTAKLEELEEEAQDLRDAVPALPEKVK